MKYMIKINGLPSEAAFNQLPFGRKLEFKCAVETFKATAKHIYFGCKRTSTAAGFKEFRKLYQPVQWYAVNHDAYMYHHDSLEIWYTNSTDEPV